MPLSVVDYWQKIGQAGKDGYEAYSMIIFEKGLVKKNEKLIRSAPKEVQKKMKEQQNELENIISGDKCILQGLLKVLGEKQGRCAHCSVHRQKKAK